VGSDWGSGNKLRCDGNASWASEVLCEQKAIRCRRLVKAIIRREGRERQLVCGRAAKVEKGRHRADCND
jgi:hypothetical protein